ncbi:MAG: Rod shape-determining protein MreD [Parcubacteria group bacterium GW2011_GWC2_38_7]|nr:MAG: Rod shape-determining protein MreD [Parcubacteria group bacterium GW2011_GWC2_38_7]
MIKKFLKHTLIITIVALLQVAILPNLANKLNNLDIVLVVLIFIAVVYKFYFSVIYGLILGFFVDIYSSLPFGVSVLCYLLTLYFVYLILQKLLTNKSFYALLGVTFIGTLVSNLLFYFFKISIYFFGTKDYLIIKNYSIISLQNIPWQISLNLFFALLLFIGFHLGSTRFKAVFIDTTKT